MIRENPYTGESTNLDSPFTSEQEAEMNAAIGEYIYGGRNQNNTQPQYSGGVYPGGYGYNPSSPQQQIQPYQMAVNSFYMQDLRGGFNNPYFNQNPYYQQVYQNSIPGNNGQVVVQGYGIGNGIPNGGYSPATFGDNSPVYNPYYSFGNQQPAQQQMQVFIEPIRMNGEYMPFTDQEDRLNDIFQKEYNRMMEDQSGNNGYGYYGNNYFGSPFATSRRSTQFERDLNELKRQNQENRRQFDIRLSKIAHGFQNDGITDEEIEKMYTGYTVNTGIRQINHNRRVALANMQVVDDNRQTYIEADLAVTKKFYETIGIDPEHCDMKTFFDNIGAYGFALEMEEERKRRIHTKQFDMNTFNYVVRTKAAQRNIELYGQPQNNPLFNQDANQNVMYSPINNPAFINPALEMLGQQPNYNQNIINQDGNINREAIKQNLSNFPTLSKATISDDGTININYNMGDISDIIKSYGDGDPEINQYEKEYEEKRQDFADTIFAPKVISPVYHPPEKVRNKSGGGG